MDKALFLEMDGTLGQYDQAKQIAFIVYSGRLTTATTQRVYQWMNGLLEKNLIQPSQIRGCIFDFQKVTDMEENNILFAQKQSETLNQKFDLSTIPVSLIVPYNDLRGNLQQVLDHSPQPERKHIVLSIEEAFEFVSQFNPQSGEPPLNTLDTPQVTGHYDDTQHLAYITYYDVVTADVTADVYGWMGRVVDHYGDKAMGSCVFDFRKVSRFDHTNTRKISQTSGQLNVNYDLSHVPVPLIVRDDKQEQLVRVTLHLTPQEKRKRLVKSVDEAWAFIDEFRKEAAKTVPEVDTSGA
jgi:hypothetical protein